MRICVISPGHLSMNPRLVKEARALLAAGHDVVVISGHYSVWGIEADQKLADGLGQVIWVSFGPFGASRFTYLRQTLVRRIANFAVRLGWTSNWIVELAQHPAMLDLSKVAQNVIADHYIAHYVAALPAAARAARRNGVSFSFDAEDFHLGDLPDIPKYNHQKGIISHIERRYLPNAAFVTAASRMIAHAYATTYNIELPTVVLNTFPMLVTLTDKPAPCEEIERPSLYWFSQTIGAGRGIETAIQAIAQAETKPHLYLRGAISRSYTKTLTSLASHVGVEDRLHFLTAAHPNNLEILGAQFDLGYIGELGETSARLAALTNKLFSYLASGLGIVATDIDSHKDIAPQLGSAIKLFKVGDPDDLSQVLDHVLSNAVILATSRSTAIELSRYPFNWDIDARKIVDLVASVDRGHQRGPVREADLEHLH